MKFLNREEFVDFLTIKLKYTIVAKNNPLQDHGEFGILSSDKKRY
jgi:hypothetical protein